jgi:hypothetical protein
MKNLLHNMEFCRDITGDSLSDAELSSICQLTVRASRRHQQIKRIRTAAALALLSTAVFWFFVRPATPPVMVQNPPIQSPPPAYTLVRTQPFVGVIKSEPLPGSHEFFAGLQPTPLLTTSAIPAYNKISDEQLLQFFQGQAVALVRLPGGRTELEFLEDQKTGRNQ